MSLAGWAANVPVLTDWFGHGISIQPNTAIAAIAAGAALMCLAGRLRWPAALLGALVAAIGGTVIYEHVTGVDLGIDRLFLFDRPFGQTAVVFPGRMGPPGAASWTIIGSAILIASIARPGSRLRRWVPGLAVATTLIASLSLIGYLYGANLLYTIPTATAIAMQTSTFVLASSIALMLTTPEVGPVAMLADRGPAGLLTRRILLPVIVVPIVLGFLRLLGARAGLYDLTFGTAAGTLIEILLLLGLLWWTASTIRTQTMERQAVERERRRIEDTLHASRQRLSETLDSISEGFTTLDHEWRFTFVNKEAERILGRDRDELLGRVVWEVFPNAVGSPAYAEVQRASRERTTVEFEVQAAGTDAWFKCRAYPGADGGIAVYFENITDRKQAEVALQRSRADLEAELADSQVLHHVSAEIVRADNVQVLYEKIVSAALGIMRADFASMQIVRPDPSRLQLIAHRGFTAEAVRHWEWVDASSGSACGFALKGGTRLIVDDVQAGSVGLAREDLRLYERLGIRALQSTPLITRAGAIIGVLSTHWNVPHQPGDRELRLLDILARQAADLIERKAAETALVEADRRKDQFLATLAHELRNPLAPIRSAVDLMKLRMDAASELAPARDVIDRQVNSLSRLLDDLLDVSRIARDKLELRLSRMDVRSALTAAIELCQPLMDRAGHDLVLRLPPDPVEVNADSARLSQVFGNLLNNAIKFTPSHGRVEIALETETSLPAAAHAVVRIRDSGIGIPDDQLSQVFELFSQAGMPLERSHAGLGIGLYLARRIIELHGGQIDVMTFGSGKGSQFTVTLPLAANVPASAGSDLRDPSSVALPVSARRILIVDDNVDAAGALATLLRLQGNDTHVVHDGHAAVAAAARINPEVVLLDLGLPAMNGFEVCRAIRSQPGGPKITVVALTGWGQDVDRRMSREAGFDHHLVKPVELTALNAVLGSPPTEPEPSASSAH